jgi:Polyketide cyclase / dehydrase and lipid transport
MPVLRESIEVEQDQREAFDAVADFSSSQRWDPGVVSARRVRDGHDSPTGVGAEYRLTVTFRGRESEMTYRTVGYEPPLEVVLEGVGPRIAATDTIRFEPLDSGGTRVDYTADLRLTGAARIAEPFMRGAFRAMGSRALAGMHAWFASGPGQGR